jgi:hypothetical protein
MDDPKYIYIDTHEAGPDFFIFPNWYDHKRVAEFVGGEVLSAGFVCFNVPKPFCHGKSTSLNVGATEFATKYLRKRYGINED